MGAMPEEVSSIVAAMGAVTARTVAGRAFRLGRLRGYDAVVVESRWGKVAAATTATHLISTFGVSHIVFTGVAGAIDPALRIGDIVVARDLYQHDLDASPIFPPMQIPLLGVTALRADPELSRRLAAAAAAFVADGLNRAIPAAARAEFGITVPRIAVGDVATGDRFFSSAGAAADLRRRLPSALCVEMEGAAVAQVCHEHGVPFAVVRTISDAADHAAHIDFPRFLGAIAGAYAIGVVDRFLSAQ